MADKNPDNLDIVEKIGFSLSLWKESWQAFLLNVVPFVAIFVAPLAALTILFTFYLAPLLIRESDAGSIALTGSVVTAILVTLAALFLFLLLMPALTAVMLASAKNKKLSIEQTIKAGLRYLIPYILALLTVGAIITGPLLLSILLIPVLIGLLLLPIAIGWVFVAGFFMYLVPYIVVAQNARPIEAIKKSYTITKQKWQWVLTLFAISILISIPGYVPVIGGLLSLAVSVIFLCLPAIIYVRFIQPDKK